MGARESGPDFEDPSRLTGFFRSVDRLGCDKTVGQFYS